MNRLDINVMTYLMNFLKPNEMNEIRQCSKILNHNIIFKYYDSINVNTQKIIDEKDYFFEFVKKYKLQIHLADVTSRHMLLKFKDCNVISVKYHDQIIGYHLQHNTDKDCYPKTLKILDLGGYKLNQSIKHIIFPSTLTHLIFGHAFNQPINDIIFPSTLIHLTFGARFNQLILNIPCNLQHLTLGYSFDQHIEDSVFPTTLIDITFIFKRKCISSFWYETVILIVNKRSNFTTACIKSNRVDDTKELGTKIINWMPI